MFKDKETCCFMHLIYSFLHDDTYYFLHVKEYEKINPNKILLGYYDNAYVHIIPSALIGAIENLMFQAGLKKLNIQKILNIHSIGELEGKIESLKDTYEKARQEINVLLSEQDRLNSLVESADNVYELSEKPSLSISEKLRLNICRQTMQKNAIVNLEDFERLKQVQCDTKQKITALNNNFENCKKLYDVYADIAKTYNGISKVDYISKFIEEKKKTGAECCEEKVKVKSDTSNFVSGT